MRMRCRSWLVISCSRFLYPIYPLICIAASAVLDSFPDLFRDRYNSNDNSLMVMVSLSYFGFNFLKFYPNMTFLHSLWLHMQIAKVIRPVVLGLILCASHARTFSLIHGYSAPLEIYKLLEHHEDVGTGESHYLAFSYYMHILPI